MFCGLLLKRQIARSGFERERIEISVAVIIILLLHFLKIIDYPVSERRGDYLNQNFRSVVEERYLDDSLSRPTFGAEESQRVKNHRVDDFTGDRRTDGAYPEISPAGEDLHLRQHERVCELAGPERHQRREDDPWRGTEDNLIRPLMRPIRRWRDFDHDPAHKRREGQRAKSRPDHAARTRVAVYFG